MTPRSVIPYVSHLTTGSPSSPGLGWTLILSCGSSICDNNHIKSGCKKMRPARYRLVQVANRTKEINLIFVRLCKTWLCHRSFLTVFWEILSLIVTSNHSCSSSDILFFDLLYAFCTASASWSLFSQSHQNDWDFQHMKSWWKWQTVATITDEW